MFYALFGIAFIILFGVVINVNSRVSKLEYIIRQGKKELPKLEDDIIQNPAPQVTESKVYKEEVQTEQNPEDIIVKWFKEDWLLKLGALLLLVGFGWLVTYAFMNNWIGPMGRILFGLIVGVILIIIGLIRANKYLNQGGIFLVLGSTIVLLTVFAAREVYGFFTPLSALGISFLSTVFVAVAGAKYKSIAISTLSVVLAGIAPLLVNSPVPDFVGLFAYLLVVIVGSICIASYLGKREVVAVSLIVYLFYSLPHFLNVFKLNSDPSQLIIFAYIFGAIFFITNIIGIIKSKNDTDSSIDILIAVINGMLLMGWIIYAAPEALKSLIITIWMIVFVIGAFTAYRLTNKAKPFIVYIGIGVVMLATATSYELEGSALKIAYIVEAGVIPLILYGVTKNIKVSTSALWLFIWPAMYSLDAVFVSSSEWTDGLVNKNSVILFAMAAALAINGLVFKILSSEQKDPNEGLVASNYSNIVFTLSSLYIYILVWKTSAVVFDSQGLAVLVAMVIYTLIGMICYFTGLFANKNYLKIYGAVMLGFVFVRLILVDAWRMQLSYRIIVFIIVGILLMSTAFIKKGKDESVITNH